MGPRTCPSIVRTLHACYVIDRKFADASLTIEAVAGLVGISAQHGRVLRRERGLTFADLLRDVRLWEAQLLRESSCSMKLRFASGSGIRASSRARSPPAAASRHPIHTRRWPACSWHVHYKQAM
jgi:hypothetical protein